MKFLCDRCKTRYSIADERVRGKILKIRCKNCSNVITVREGMPEPEPEVPGAPRAERAPARPTDHTPAIVGAAPGKPAPKPAPLAAAFAQEMQRPAAPPPQLEEEWYLSIDGNQEGPFALPAAQAWVRARKPDDDLYCWCEGFDDWLPIEKVSHFRGLRAKKAAPKPPPPRAPAREEEPKPLFAAALAAVEASTAPRPAPAPAPMTPAMPLARAPLPAPSRGQVAKATPIGGTPKPPVGMFDQSDAADGDVAAAPPPEPARRAPVPLADLDDDDKVNGNDAGDLDDDLAIGEVSRVVRLQDIAAASRKPATAKRNATPAPRATQSIQALTEAAAPQSALAEAAHAAIADEHGHDAATPDVPAAMLAPVASLSTKKRQQVIIAAVGAALLLALVAIVIVVAGSDDDAGGGARAGGFGGDVEGLAISVDDPRYPGRKPGATTDPAADTPAGGGTTKRPRGGGSTSRPGGGQVATQPGGAGGGKTEVMIGPDGRPLTSLTPDDVVSKAMQMSTGYNRCYQRALKDDPFLKVKSIGALITIGRDGKVSEVSLDQMQSSNLGQCLVAAIKRWTFRPNSEGLNTKITLKFEQTL